MPRTEHVDRVGALDQHHIDALLGICDEAVAELRSWNDPDPRLADLIGRLESLGRLLGRLSRLDD